MHLSVSWVLGSCSLVVLAAACGSNGDGGPSDADLSGSGSASSSGGGNGTGASSSDLATDLGTDLAADGGADLGVDGSATGGNSVGGAGPVCEQVSSAAETAPVFLGFAFDVSGSMGKLDSPNWWHDPASKWTPVVAATSAFFESASSTGLEASMALFPAEDASCDSETYVEPTVPMTGLPSTAFSEQFQAYEAEVGSPLAGGDWRGGTPTYAAALGVSEYLASLREGTPNGRFALVLVTDGLPQGCDEELEDVVTAVEDFAADGIPTYVIGIENPTTAPASLPDDWDDWGDCDSGDGGGDTPCAPLANLEALNDIAEAGGTNSAFLIDTGDPVATQAAFTAAIDAIRSRAVSCDLAIPPHPEPGMSFEGDKIDVSITVDGTTTTLPYDEACSEPVGWHFDDPDMPLQIELCASTCASLQTATEAAAQVNFLCEPRVDVIK